MASWICQECDWANPDSVTQCRSCGATRAGVEPGKPEAAATPAWQTSSGTTYATPTSRSAAGGLIGGLALGAGAAAVATVAWYLIVALSEYQIAFVAIAVGWLVGSAVVWGSGRRVSWPLIVASPLLTLVALAVSEYLIVYHVVTQELGITVDLIQPIDVMVEIVIESITADPSTLVFWGIALVASAWIPFRTMTQPAPPETTSAGVPGEP
jgi:hypothetical protein